MTDHENETTATTRSDTGVDSTTRSPHVWIVNQYALPRGSTGITRHGDLSSIMYEQGLSVTVIASNFDNFMREGTVYSGKQLCTNHAGVNFAWIPTSAYNKNDGRRVLNMVEFYLRSVSTRLARTLGKPDVVIGSSPHLLSALAGLHLARRYGARFVLELRDVWPEDLVSMGSLREGSPMHRLLVSLARHLERQADEIISVPPKLATHMVNRGVPANKVVSIPNGTFLNGENGPLAELPDSLERLLQEQGDAFVIMYMGAHGVANGLHNILDAAELLKAERPDSRICFLLIGAGQERPSLMERASRLGLDNVGFHPPIPKLAVPTAASRAHALLVHFAAAPTFDEYGRSPNKLYDYLAAGRPVLFGTSDNSTILTEFDAGITFEPGNPRALVDAAVALTSMPQESRDAMGQRGRQALIGRHDLTILGDKLAHVVRKLVATST